MIQLPKIYLASKSPRRRQILRNAGFDIELISIQVEETYPFSLKPEEIAEYLAKKKMSAVKSNFQDGILLTADTIVILNNEVLEKPKDDEHAMEMLQKLSDNTHTVITGVCLKFKDRKKCFSVESQVYVDPMSKDEIRFYIDTFHPFDKAGAYGIQDWLGMCKVSEIHGSYYNVMGLPIYEVYQEIKTMIT